MLASVKVKSLTGTVIFNRSGVDVSEIVEALALNTSRGRRARTAEIKVAMSARPDVRVNTISIIHKAYARLAFFAGSRDVSSRRPHAWRCYVEENPVETNARLATYCTERLPGFSYVVDDDGNSWLSYTMQEASTCSVVAAFLLYLANIIKWCESPFALRMTSREYLRWDTFAKITKDIAPISDADNASE